MTDIRLEITEGLVVRPGDTLVLRLPGDMYPAQFERFRGQTELLLQEKLPGVNVVFFAGVEQMAVLRPDQDVAS